MGFKYTTSERAVLTTLLYSDIFSFPPTRDELWRFLIADKKISRPVFDKSLKSLQKYISQKDGYFCLKGREIIIARRKENLPEVVRKMQQARFAAQKLSTIPSILFIGVSGGLAVGNVTSGDDIDLVIITRKSTLFMSRLLILGKLERLGMRRSWNQKHTANTICVNLLFDETALGWFGKYKNLYTAREIAQLMPLFEKVNTYQRFMDENVWIKRFLPNINRSSLRRHEFIKISNIDSCFRGNYSLVSRFINGIFINPFFETHFRNIQMSWMKRHQTTETVTKQVLAFHPNNYKSKTLKQLKLKMRQFGLLTKF